MTAEEPPNKYQKLVKVLKWYDDESRNARAARIDWVSSLFQSPGFVSGELVPLHMMEEARVCFVNGQYMATVLCASSAVEHLLVAELKTSGSLATKLTLGQSIKDAENKYSPQTIDHLKKLNELRNPLVHRREVDDDSTFAKRYLAKQIHPDALKEKDARFSLEVMYEFFMQVLKLSAYQIDETNI